VIFLTVGSALPFDRLVQMVDGVLPSLQLQEPVFAQIGRGRYKPKHFEYIDFLPKTEFDKAFDEASLVISHAGIGTIGIALRTGKPILVMPRQEAFGELVDDHQMLTANKFEALGHVLAFSTPGEFTAKMSMLREFSPKARHANVEGISSAVEDFLARV
jgi:beta-1,4-N-acetylglucosaminyltransferase